MTTRTRRTPLPCLVAPCRRPLPPSTALPFDQFAGDTFYDCLPVNDEELVILTSARFLVADKARLGVRHNVKWEDVDSVRLEPARAGPPGTTYVQVLCRGVGRVDLLADAPLARLLVDALERQRQEATFSG
jgi:hypothetical protein